MITAQIVPEPEGPVGFITVETIKSGTIEAHSWLCRALTVDHIRVGTITATHIVG